MCTGIFSGRCSYFLQTGSAVLSCQCCDCSCLHPAWSYQSGAGTLTKSLAGTFAFGSLCLPVMWFLNHALISSSVSESSAIPVLCLCPFDEQPQALLLECPRCKACSRSNKGEGGCWRSLGMDKNSFMGEPLIKKRSYFTVFLKHSFQLITANKRSPFSGMVEGGSHGSS